MKWICKSTAMCGTCWTEYQSSSMTFTTSGVFTRVLTTYHQMSLNRETKRRKKLENPDLFSNYKLFSPIKRPHSKLTNRDVLAVRIMAQKALIKIWIGRFQIFE